MKEQITRREFLKLTSRVAGGLALAASGLELFGCSQKVQTSSISTESSTTTQQKTITTEAPTTTSTTEAPTTMTTEAQAGVNPEFISKEKTLADVAGKIAKGENVKKMSDVPVELNNLFRTKNPGKNILWVGKSNKDDGVNGQTMRAVVTNQLLSYPTEPAGYGQRLDFFGGDPNDQWKSMGYETDRFETIRGEFVDIIPAASPEEPDTKDFYMRLRDPITRKEMYARICLGTKFTNIDPVFTFYTRIGLIDLQKKVQDAPPDWKNPFKPPDDALKFFLEKHAASEAFLPGDIITLTFDGRINQGKLQTVIDGKDTQVASWMLIERFNGADDVKRILSKAS